MASYSGAGPIGQLALQVAIARGAGTVVVVDPSEFRRGVAERCGGRGSNSEPPKFALILHVGSNCDLRKEIPSMGEQCSVRCP